MKKKDAGTIHKLFALILLMWVVICWSILLELMRAEYVSRYLEDSLTQANLAALLIDPYHYGSTGELVFEDVEETKRIFTDFLDKGMGSEETKQALGIIGDVEVLDFRVYEVTSVGTSEFHYDNYNCCRQKLHDKAAVVAAPDGTAIQNSSIYAKIAVTVEFLFGVHTVAIKEHCVDMVSEGIGYE